jgi:hypothetical protein
MTHNEKILRKKVTEKSVSDKPFDEWEIDRLEVGSGNDICLCSKQGIFHLCYLRNKNTNEVILVGSECVKKFFGQDYSKEFEQLRKAKEKEQRAELHKEVLSKIEEKQKEVNQWEKEFLNSIKNNILNGWQLSEKQDEILNRIMTEEKVDVSFLDKLKPENEWEIGFLKSVREVLISHKKLSERQQEFLDKIMNRNKPKQEVQADLFPIQEEEQKMIDRANLDFSDIKHTPRPYQIVAYLKWKENNYIGSAEMRSEEHTSELQ